MYIHIWKCVSLRFINFIRITICVRAFHSMYYIPSESKLWYTQLISFDGRLNENCSCTCVLLYFQDTHTHTPNTLVPTVIIMEIIIIIMLTMIMRCIESDKRSYSDTRYSLYAFGLFHFINNANTTKYIYTQRENRTLFKRCYNFFQSNLTAREMKILDCREPGSCRAWKYQKWWQQRFSLFYDWTLLAIQLLTLFFQQYTHPPSSFLGRQWWQRLKLMLDVSITVRCIHNPKRIPYRKVQ